MTYYDMVGLSLAVYRWHQQNYRGTSFYEYLGQLENAGTLWNTVPLSIPFIIYLAGHNALTVASALCSDDTDIDECVEQVMTSEVIFDKMLFQAQKPATIALSVDALAECEQRLGDYKTAWCAMQYLAMPSAQSVDLVCRYGGFDFSAIEVFLLAMTGGWQNTMIGVARRELKVALDNDDADYWEAGKHIADMVCECANGVLREHTLSATPFSHCVVVDARPMYLPFSISSFDEHGHLIDSYDDFLPEGTSIQEGNTAYFEADVGGVFYDCTLSKKSGLLVTISIRGDITGSLSLSCLYNGVPYTVLLKHGDTIQKCQYHEVTTHDLLVNI